MSSCGAAIRQKKLDPRKTKSGSVAGARPSRSRDCRCQKALNSRPTAAARNVTHPNRGQGRSMPTFPGLPARRTACRSATASGPPDRDSSQNVAGNRVQESHLFRRLVAASKHRHIGRPRLYVPAPPGQPAMRTGCWGRKWAIIPATSVPTVVGLTQRVDCDGQLAARSGPSQTKVGPLLVVPPNVC